MTFLDQIRRTIARYDMLRPGDGVGIAVSGGADSLCLLYVLFELRPEFNLSLSVIHIDHNLRGGESQADAQFVHKSAQQLGLPFHLRNLDLDRHRGNLEQEARRARHAFFHELIRTGVVQKVALGHTRSDQAETILFRLLRGSGSAGFSGIRPVTDDGFMRPLLQVTRPQVEEWLRERNIDWREDSSNSQRRFDRNRIRHELIPGLESEWNPKLSETLARTADWAFEEERYWNQEISRLSAEWVRFAESAAILDVSAAREMPVAVVRRIVRRVVEHVKGDLRGIGFDHVDSIRNLLAQPEGDGRIQVPGVEVTRSLDWVCFEKSGRKDPAANENWEIIVTVPGKYSLPCVTNGNFSSLMPPETVELKLFRNSPVYNRDVNALDWDRAVARAKASIVLRNWRPGDQYQRQGHAGSEKIKTLFQENRIPVWERQHWPVITVGDSIAWVRQFGPAAQFAVDAASRTVLSIHETHQFSDEA